MDNHYFHGEVTNILSRRRETLSVNAVANQAEGERKALVELKLDTDDEPANGRRPMGTMCPDDARALAMFLWDAAAIAELLDQEVRAGIIGVRELPKIMLCGTEFFIDERLRQMRNAQNPDHWFDLDDPMSM